LAIFGEKMAAVFSKNDVMIKFLVFLGEHICKIKTPVPGPRAPD
jgi:hypothetical protein